MCNKAGGKKVRKVTIEFLEMFAIANTKRVNVRYN